MAIIPAPQATTKPPVETLEEKFHRLKAAWKKDTAHHSSTSIRNNHPAYQEIIAMGWDVVPLLLREVAATGEHWFHALKSITGASPVPPEARGRMDQVVAAWVQWGRDHGYSLP